MLTSMIAIFVVGYLFIALEHNFHINKTASALLTGVLCWTVYALGSTDYHEVTHQLQHHLGQVSEILFFLLGAMTIVEMIDSHQGFKIITNRITTKNKKKLIWVLSIITFFMSALLDNLTTSIVMVSLLRKLVHDVNERRLFAGIVIIAANAGGAWSPIGDVTTTMLWIGGQVSTVNIIATLILPSLVCMFVPLIILSFKLKGDVYRDSYDHKAAKETELVKGSRTMFALGVGALLFVPIFKTVTHLPPYMGMLLGLGVVWVASELMHVNKEEEEKKTYTALHALSKIDTASVLFFLGILIAIGSLEVTGVLDNLAKTMSNAIGNMDIIVMAIGLGSAIVDNVPLVAASMGMYPLASATVNPEAFAYAMANPQVIEHGAFVFNNITYYLQDAKMWEFMAYAAGTGGSALIIGSASGVAVMGMERIDFMWYVKNITLLAVAGFFSGAIVYLLTHTWFAVH